MKNNSGAGAIYGIGFLGALVYFIQHAGSVMEGIVGFILAIFWPGVIVYKALELLNV